MTYKIHVATKIILQFKLNRTVILALVYQDFHITLDHLLLISFAMGAITIRVFLCFENYLHCAESV